MSSVNSGIGTKACVYNFAHDGGLGVDGSGNPIFVYSGIAFKPGDVILDVRVQLFSSVIGAAATIINIGWGQPSGFVPLYQTTVAQMNASLFAFWGRTGAAVTAASVFADSGTADYKPHIVFGTGITLNVSFNSDGALTGGKFGVLFTYAYTRF